MTLPILAYGHPALRLACHEVNIADEAWQQVVADMWNTMYNAKGCGLAASQMGLLQKIFVVDSAQTYQALNETDRQLYFPEGQGIKEVFINAQIINCSARTWAEEEGCLSIPVLTGWIERPWSITIQYTDQFRQPQQKTFSGSTARMIQHEYDHTKGVLYLDYLKPLTKKMLEGKLQKIKAGKIRPPYPMKFYR